MSGSFFYFLRHVLLPEIFVKHKKCLQNLMIAASLGSLGRKSNLFWKIQGRFLLGIEFILLINFYLFLFII